MDISFEGRKKKTICKKLFPTDISTLDELEEEFNRLNVISIWIPMHREYSNYMRRLKSFRLWSLFLKPTPETLALSGFVFSGENDSVYCFHCGVSLNDWTHIDDPLTRHRLSSSNCIYLNMIS